MPQRYRKAQDQYQALMLQIEMTERSFLDDAQNLNGGSGAKLDPRTEKDRLQKLFDEARADQQANYPDLYVSLGTTTAKDSKDLVKQLVDAKAETVRVQNEMVARIEALMLRLENKAETLAEDKIYSALKV